MKKKIINNFNETAFACRSPYFARDPLGFEIVVIVGWIIPLAYLITIMIFSTIYIVICINIASYVDDLAMNAPHLNHCIARRISIKNTLSRLLESHLNYYRWEIIAFIGKSANCEVIALSVALNNNWPFICIFPCWFPLIISTDKNYGSVGGHYPNANFLPNHHIHITTGHMFVWNWSSKI